MIAWSIPDDGNAPVSGYTIKIRQDDGVSFTEDTTNCDGQSSSIVSLQSCTVPISRLRSNPYNLEWGSSVYVKVTAINSVGTSEESDQGNGAVILTVPDAPVDFMNDPLVTSAT